MKRSLMLVIAALFLVAALLIPLSCTPPSSDIIAGTSLIAGIAEDLAGGKLEVQNLIPPGMCPGHYDVKPSDVETLANSKALLIHPWQEEKANITSLIEAVDNPDLIVKVIAVEGNWMAPPVQAEAVEATAAALGEIDPQNAALYQQRAEDRLGAIQAKGEEAKARLLEAGVGEVRVICSEEQTGFVKWAGFDLVATYGRPEELSVADIEQLVVQAKEAGVTLVIDNLQSGGTANSETIAQDIGAAQVTISNFPGGFQGTETWEKTLDNNVDLLLEALAQ
jgi:zinc transport system substrate-binding protein